MDHWVSGDNHIIITITCTQLVYPRARVTGWRGWDPVCRSDPGPGWSSLFSLSRSRLVVGRSSCGGRVSVIFPVTWPAANQQWYSNGEDQWGSGVQYRNMYSTVHVQSSAVRSREKCNSMFYNRTRRPSKDFHQESRSLSVFMFGLSYKKYWVGFPSTAQHCTVPWPLVGTHHGPMIETYEFLVSISIILSADATSNLQLNFNQDTSKLMSIRFIIWT